MPFIDLDQIDEKEIVPGFKAKFVHTNNMTFAYWRITAGNLLPDHKHPQEQVSNLIEGSFELTVDGETRTLTPGTAVVVPSDVPHSGKAITDCFIIDVFYPIREDYK